LEILVANISNRSKYVVSVVKRDDLTRSFPYDDLKAVKAYVDDLKAQKLKPRVEQEETNIHVRIRNKGHRPQTMTFGSMKEADAFIKKVEAEQAHGLFRDYTKARGVTTVELCELYIEEECPGLKGGDNYAIILRALIADANDELRRRIERRKREYKEFGRFVTPLKANRNPMTSLEWMNRPMTEVTAVDIECFIRDRLEFVAEATVNRQLDILRAVYNIAIKTWGYHVERHPMEGVRRPSFFNERDRRLRGDEEVRLLDAARRHDQLCSVELRTQELLTHARTAASEQKTTYAAKQVIRDAYPQAQREALASYSHVPFFEALVQFQLATAARRGETLALLWENLDFDNQVAKLPTSKNGRPRNLAVRRDILELLDKLPRESDLMFDIGEKELRNAWKRICADARIEDLHLHDLRHEAISRAAESGLFPTVLDLQAYSGHRDLRSLSRYTHIMPTAVAKRLDAAELQRQEAMGHHGRQRMKNTELLNLGATPLSPSGAPKPAVLPTNVITVNFERSAA
jgi:integrase